MKMHYNTLTLMQQPIPLVKFLFIMQHCYYMNIIELKLLQIQFYIQSVQPKILTFATNR